MEEEKHNLLPHSVVWHPDPSILEQEARGSGFQGQSELEVSLRYLRHCLHKTKKLLKNLFWVRRDGFVVKGRFCSFKFSSQHLYWITQDHLYLQFPGIQHPFLNTTGISTHMQIPRHMYMQLKRFKIFK